MNEVIRFIKNWMLPIAIVAGITLFLAFHLLPFLSEAEPVFLRVASLVQPVLVSIMLFLQLTVVAPSDLKPRRWFVIIGAIQCLSFVLFSLLASRMEPGLWRILAECAMLCLIAPTAAAAGVITAKIGGSISHIMAYTVVINVLAALLIPLMVPIVNPSADIGFLASFAISFVISFAIGLLVPMPKVNEALCRTFKLQPRTPKANLVQSVVTNLIYTPLLTTVLVVFAYFVQIPDGHKPPFLPMYMHSMVICLVVAQVLIFVCVPLILKLVLPKGGPANNSQQR